MIRRPPGLVTAEVNCTVNFLTYDQFEMDLGHINKFARSKFEGSEVALIVLALIDGVVIDPSGEQAFGTYKCLYFVKVGIFEMKKYKLVFCQCSDRPHSLGIITLHRVGDQ